MEILAQTISDMAWWERAIDRFGFPACALISIAVFLFFIARRLTPHAENIAVAHVKMVNTFSETLPKLADASEKQTELLTESLRRDSDFRESINNLGQAIVSAACPERKEQAQKDVDRANRRARSLAPQFRNPPEAK